MEEQKITVRAVERALDILLCFTVSAEMGMTEIAEKVSLHKSTVHRLLATLEMKGFVKRDPVTEKYSLGFRVWELYANLSQTDEPAFLLLPEMEKLRDLLGETVSLYIRDGNERIRIQAVQSHESVRRVAPVGVRLPLFVGASSKVLIAFADTKERARLLSDIPWPRTMDLKAYQAQLKEIRKNGYATSLEEREPGVSSVAVPIFNRQNKLVAALSVSGPISRLTPDKLKEYSKVLMEAAQRMGKMIH